MQPAVNGEVKDTPIKTETQKKFLQFAISRQRSVIKHWFELYELMTSFARSIINEQKSNETEAKKFLEKMEALNATKTFIVEKVNLYYDILDLVIELDLLNDKQMQELVQTNKRLKPMQFLNLLLTETGAENLFSMTQGFTVSGAMQLFPMMEIKEASVKQEVKDVSKKTTAFKTREEVLASELIQDLITGNLDYFDSSMRDALKRINKIFSPTLPPALLSFLQYNTV